MAQFKVLLSDGTVGRCYGEIDSSIVGKLWPVEVQDENGNKIQVIGVVEELFEEI